MNPLFLILYMMELFISLNSCSTFDSSTFLISELWMIAKLVWGWRTPVLSPVFVSTEAVIANYWKGLKSILLYMLTLRPPFNILSSLSLHQCSFDSVISKPRREQAQQFHGSSFLLTNSLSFCCFIIDSQGSVEVMIPAPLNRLRLSSVIIVQ